jgi:hypothetical protein
MMFIPHRKHIYGPPWPVTGVEWSGVEWSLRPTVSRPVRFGVGTPFGAHDQILMFLYSDIYLHLYVGRPL